MSKKKKNADAPARLRVVAYVRVSTEQQAAEGSSLDAQKAKLQMYADLMGYEIVEWFSDEGQSASSLDRPGLQDALAAIHADYTGTRAADGLLVVKLDRLTRSVRDLCALVEDYFSSGARLLSASEAVDTSTAAGRLVLNILMTVAQWEREAAAERTTAVMQHLKATGKFTGGFPPFGWRVGQARVTIDTKKIRESITWKREYMMKSYGQPFETTPFFVDVAVSDLEALLDVYERVHSLSASLASSPRTTRAPRAAAPTSRPRRRSRGR